MLSRGRETTDPPSDRASEDSSARTGVEDAQFEASLEALFYGLLDPVGEVGAKLDEIGWELPLLEIGKGQNVRFTRHEIHWDQGAGPGNEVQPRLRRAWKKGDRLAVRIGEVAKVLQGMQMKTGPSDRKQGSQWCSRIRAESEEFWRQAGIVSRALDSVGNCIQLVEADTKGA